MVADPPNEDGYKFRQDNPFILEIQIKWDVILVHLADVVDAKE